MIQLTAGLIHAAGVLKIDFPPLLVRKLLCGAESFTDNLTCLNNIGLPHIYLFFYFLYSFNFIVFLINLLLIIIIFCIFQGAGSKQRIKHEFPCQSFISLPWILNPYYSVCLFEIDCFYLKIWNLSKKKNCLFEIEGWQRPSYLNFIELLQNIN